MAALEKTAEKSTIVGRTISQFETDILIGGLNLSQ